MRTKTITVILTALIISLAVSYVAVAWTPAPGDPPGGNVPTPLHIGDTQTKTGGGLNVMDRVGIGTTSPSWNLHVHENSASYRGIGFTNTESDVRIMVGSTGIAYLRTVSDRLYMGTNNSNILNIRGGNVGIGTTTPGEKLDVAGNINVDGRIIFKTATYNRSSDGQNRLYFWDGGATLLRGDPGIQFRTGSNNTRMVILANGNVGIGTASPGAKLDIEGDDNQSVFGLIGRSQGETTNTMLIGPARNFGFTTGRYDIGIQLSTGANPRDFWFGATTGTVKVRATHSFDAPQLCIGGSCRTSWPSSGGYSSAETRSTSVAAQDGKNILDAFCRSGWTMTGGGCSHSHDDPYWKITTTRPNGNGWRCIGTYVPGGTIPSGRTMYAWVRCVQ